MKLSKSWREAPHYLGPLLRLFILDLAERVVQLRATPVIAGVPKEIDHSDAVVDPIGDLKRSENALKAGWWPCSHRPSCHP